MAANSRQARAVLDAVRRLDHPTADEVFAAVRSELASVSLATVYRNLSRLAEEGEIAVREVGGSKRYDPHVADHIHLHDVETDVLRDVPLPPELDAALRSLAARHGHAATELVIEVRGRTLPHAEENR